MKMQPMLSSQQIFKVCKRIAVLYEIPSHQTPKYMTPQTFKAARGGEYIEMRCSYSDFDSRNLLYLICSLKAPPKTQKLGYLDKTKFLGKESLVFRGKLEIRVAFALEIMNGRNMFR